jgi:hypothetical protein
MLSMLVESWNIHTFFPVKGGMVAVSWMVMMPMFTGVGHEVNTKVQA